MMNGGVSHHQHQQRRTFRGRGGPTDGRLPKHGFHPKRQAKKSTRTYGDNNDDDAVDAADLIVTAETLPAVVESSSLTGTICNGDDDENFKCNVECENADDDNDNAASSSSSSSTIPVNDTTAVTLPESLSSSSQSSSFMSKKKKQEMEHLMRRIRQNREAWSLSTVALANPETYRINVLQATLNCVKEYKSILKFYQNHVPNNNNNDDQPAVLQDSVKDVDDNDNDDKIMSLAIYELIQHALQCGPLSGGKPGYFKRCGSQVATMVHAWLVELVANQNEAIFQMKMTEKQAMAIEKFKAHALRAAENTNKPAPSKHVLKNQDAAQKHKTKKNEKRGAGAGYQ